MCYCSLALLLLVLIVVLCDLFVLWMPRLLGPCFRSLSTSVAHVCTWPQGGHGQTHINGGGQRDAEHGGLDAATAATDPLLAGAQEPPPSGRESTGAAQVETTPVVEAGWGNSPVKNGARTPASVWPPSLMMRMVIKWLQLFLRPRMIQWLQVVRWDTGVCACLFAAISVCCACCGITDADTWARVAWRQLPPHAPDAQEEEGLPPGAIASPEKQASGD